MRACCLRPHVCEILIQVAMRRRTLDSLSQRSVITRRAPWLEQTRWPLPGKLPLSSHVPAVPQGWRLRGGCDYARRRKLVTISLLSGPVRRMARRRISAICGLEDPPTVSGAPAARSRMCGPMALGLLARRPRRRGQLAALGCSECVGAHLPPIVLAKHSGSRQGYSTPWASGSNLHRAVLFQDRWASAGSLRAGHLGRAAGDRRSCSCFLVLAASLVVRAGLYGALLRAI